MTSVEQALAAAVQHHQAGRLDAAEAIYRQILAVDPRQADALHLLGVVASQRGQYGAAVELISRAIAVDATQAGYFINLGNALSAQGKWSEAEVAFRRAVALQPNLAEAHCSLANAQKSRGMLADAEASYREALRLNPRLAVAHSNLGAALKSQGRLDEAIGCYRQAVELMPNLAEAHVNLGNTLSEQRQLAEAIASYRRALELKPDVAETLNNLGHALQERGNLDEAIAAYHRAIEIEQDYAEAHSNLGSAYKAQVKLDEAVACYRRAVELKPDLAVTQRNLGNAYMTQGLVEEALGCFRRALEVQPGYTDAHDSLLLALHYRADIALSELAAAHTEYDRQQAEALRTTWRNHANDRDPERRLRVGFVSADLRQHPVGYFLIRCLENIDREQCETFCYSDWDEEDALTERFRAAAATWRDVKPLSDPKLAELIRGDRVDILFDLAGHTAHNRLLVFARKPAPIQVAWAGYMGTTGLRAIDYILADRYEIPVEAEGFYVERVLRMPDGYVCFEPPPHAPEVSPLPALQRGLVTFGSFNNPAKVTPRVIEVWAKILAGVPRSRLVLKYLGFGDAGVGRRIAAEFARHGIGPERIECQGAAPHSALLAEYNRIDLALDPFPYSGGLTTCEALWMGVPVVTWPGETFASRHSLSHLSNVGLTETIASDFEDYVRFAVSLAEDLPRLAALRAGLRARIAASPLCDGPRFATNLLKVLREAWRQNCRETGA